MPALSCPAIARRSLAGVLVPGARMTACAAQAMGSPCIASPTQGHMSSCFEVELNLASEAAKIAEGVDMTVANQRRASSS